tara:strand:+ start:889 stop:1002 length:114 start_codon:yes stop_codon:yes gene_type:complete
MFRGLNQAELKGLMAAGGMAAAAVEVLQTAGISRTYR